VQVQEAEGCHEIQHRRRAFVFVLWNGHSLYVRRIGQLLDITSKVALSLYQDNTSTIIMTYMGKGSAQSNSKFMDLKYFWIKQQLYKGLLRLVYLATESMAADFFASPRSGSSFRHFRSIIMGEGT
jgi:hypothetical protein